MSTPVTKPKIRSRKTRSSRFVTPPAQTTTVPSTPDAPPRKTTTRTYLPSGEELYYKVVDSDGDTDIECLNPVTLTAGYHNNQPKPTALLSPSEQHLVSKYLYYSNGEDALLLPL